MLRLGVETIFRVRRMLGALGAPAYRQEVGLWNHRYSKLESCNFKRKQLNVSRFDAMARNEI